MTETERKLPCGAIVNDRRKDKTTPWAFVVMTDAFMSGLGKANGRSLYALAVSNPDEAKRVMDNASRRREMKRVRLVQNLRNVKLKRGDHLSIADRNDAARWYESGAFTK